MGLKDVEGGVLVFDTVPDAPAARPASSVMT
jgi:hypothetical protein